jgi:deoxyribose-phosphate aldolase
MTNNTLTDLIITATTIPIDAYPSKQIISLLGLTSLNDNDTEAAIIKLCERAKTPIGNVAAVCIYSQFISTAHHALLNKNIKIATVANFPHGNNPIETVITEITSAINNGANEIDVVMPYQIYLKSEREIIEKFVTQCKQACGKTILLKVILETGALQDPKLIYQASRAAIDGGADFIKTSTGKIAVHATLEAAAIMLQTIKDSGTNVGFKAAGGIRTMQQAVGYLYLAETIMSKNWLKPTHFRLGASILLDDLLANCPWQPSKMG